MKSNKRDIIIIGGGLVGALCACFMAKLGYNIRLYEYRDDMRKIPPIRGKSINLSLSNRGRKALREVGLEEAVLAISVPMTGRFIHDESGKTRTIVYDSLYNQCTYSVGRNSLNCLLLTAAESYSTVQLIFKQKLVDANLELGKAVLMDFTNKRMVEDYGNLIIGSDGAFSSLRRIMQQTPLFNFCQSYIEHGYLELCIDSKKGKAMKSNCLHIWPRGEFMMIALPNKNCTWTVTLFMPFERFKLLDNEQKLLDFFKRKFPDAVPLLGVEQIIDTVLTGKPSTLLTIKCDVYHIGDKSLIIGDAAHAMVPFYGQGMNAGFEDCLLFYNLLKENSGNIQKTLAEFTRNRKDDAHIICDMAHYNYTEMRDLVTRPTYFLRKKLDDILFQLFPKSWIPLYNSVTFSSMSYKQCSKNRSWQDKIIRNILMFVLSATFIGICYAMHSATYT